MEPTLSNFDLADQVAETMIQSGASADTIAYALSVVTAKIGDPIHSRVRMTVAERLVSNIKGRADQLERCPELLDPDFGSW